MLFYVAIDLLPTSNCHEPSKLSCRRCSFEACIFPRITIERPYHHLHTLQSPGPNETASLSLRIKKKKAGKPGGSVWGINGPLLPLQDAKFDASHCQGGRCIHNSQKLVPCLCTHKGPCPNRRLSRSICGCATACSRSSCS